MRILTYVATQADEGRAVRTVAPRRFSLGNHAFRRLKVLGAIRVAGETVRADYVLHAGDVLEVYLPDDMAGETAAYTADSVLSMPELPPSYIRYMDEDIIIAAKGAPLPTLPASHITSGTLREQMIAMLGADEAAFVYHPVNRLDKGTSGLLCIARHAHAQRLLTKQLHTGSFVREYLAVTQGVPAQMEGIIDAPIARLGAGAQRAVREDGQHALTHYRVERICAGRALLRLRLETGRTHQIRVHLAHIGCPIAGDYLYGVELAPLCGRFALHSARISLVQPVTGSRIELDEPLPPELEALLTAEDAGALVRDPA
ncbi:MAG: RluA family pseudouridine synthase [Clostridia bacterium]|nr:RluA family pseudouridine synthase [Clostridia bacterium]